MTAGGYSSSSSAYGESGDIAGSGSSTGNKSFSFGNNRRKTEAYTNYLMIGVAVLGLWVLLKKLK